MKPLWARLWKVGQFGALVGVQGIVGKVINRGENHFLVASHEPQADGAMLAILRRRCDFDVPDDAVFVGSGSAGDGHDLALIERRQRLIRGFDGQPPPVAFEEIRENIDLEIADVDVVGARERADDESGFGCRQRHGAILKDEHPAIVDRIGCRRRPLSRPPTGCQEQQEQKRFIHVGEDSAYGDFLKVKYWRQAYPQILHRCADGEMIKALPVVTGQAERAVQHIIEGFQTLI